MWYKDNNMAHGITFTPKMKTLAEKLLLEKWAAEDKMWKIILDSKK